MKIRAIRLREVGGFTQPVALEGLSGELDVLAGPNELGKSTILKALQALFFAGHKSRATKKSGWLTGLQPIAGGAPLIEADFEAGGRSWRLRKQFLSGASAYLGDLATGSAVSRGAEADAQVLELMNARADAGAPFGLLWVGQKESFQAVEPKPGEEATLRGLVESEIEDVADGGRARNVRKMVAAQLAELVTGTSRKVKKNSPYDKAVKSRDEIKQKLDTEREKSADAASRRHELNALGLREQGLGDSEAVDQRTTAVERARAMRDAGNLAREKLRSAAAVLDKCLAEQQAADKALVDFEARLDELAKLERAGKDTAPLLIDLENRQRQSDTAAAESKQRRETLRHDLAGTAAILQKAEQAEKQQQARATLAALHDKLTDARASHRQIGSLSAELDVNEINEGRVVAARRESSAISTLQAQLTAAAPKVSIAYAKGGAGKIKVAGRPVAEGTQFEPDRALVLDIKDVGRITIQPGRPDDIDDMRADSDARKEQLADLLGSMGAADLADAEQKLAARRDTESRLSEATARLSALAPQGLDAMADEAQKLDAICGGDDSDDDDPGAREALELALSHLQASLKEADEAYEKQRAEAGVLKEDLVRLGAEAASGARRLEELARALPGAGKREELRRTRTEARAVAERAVNAANRELQDLRDEVGDEVQMAALQTGLKEAEAAKHAAETELIEIRLGMKTIEGALAAYAAGGVEVRVQELDEQLELAEADVTRFQRETEALLLLSDMLARAERETRDRFVAPVLDRIKPYLDLMLPGAALQIGDKLRVSELERNQIAQPVSILSVGTQEQVAVAVRLGFARLLAETGAPLPLILDDALVYSDDDRIARAFKALELAARHHQVVVLTCRTNSFERLGGKRLELTPWAVTQV